MNLVLVLWGLSVIVVLYNLFKGFIKESFNTIFAIGFILLFIVWFITWLTESLWIL